MNFICKRIASVQHFLSAISFKVTVQFDGNRTAAWWMWLPDHSAGALTMYVKDRYIHEQTIQMRMMRCASWILHYIIFF